jgi:ABC-2 type transport system permease protein
MIFLSALLHLKKRRTPMHKSIRIAIREYLATVRTKGFILGLVLAPILMFGGIIAMALLKDRVDTSDKKMVIIDYSGRIADTLIARAEQRNREEVFDKQTGKKIKPAYILEKITPDTADPEKQKLDLSQQIRSQQIHAFLEIGPDIVHPGEDSEEYRLSYYAENAMLDDMRGWVEWPVNYYLRDVRLQDSGIDPSQVGDLFHWVNVEGLGLVSRNQSTGEVTKAERSDEFKAFLIPFAMLMLMFIMMMMGAVPMLNSVVEEKTQRIAEVILGSATPFQFMFGKLLGGVGVSLTASAVYVLGGSLFLGNIGLEKYVPMHILPWFFVYMLLSIFMFGSLLAALGSACNDPKDAQSLTMPAMLPMIIPMFVIFPIAKEPLGSLATVMSLIPPFTPMVMLLRQASPVTIPAWQPWVGLAGIIALTLLAVWLGGRIFRIGILMQGKPPKLTDVVRWAFKG